MKKIILTLSFLLSLNALLAQDTNAIKKNIEACTKKMKESFLKKDCAEYVNYSLPTMVEMLGGKEGFVKAVGQAMESLADSSIKHFEFGKPMQLLKTAQDWQTVIEQKLDLFIEGKMIRSTTYLIGQSLDEGNTWTFFDSKGDRETAKKFKPNLSDQLIIPQQKQFIDESYKP